MGIRPTILGWLGGLKARPILSGNPSDLSPRWGAALLVVLLLPIVGGSVWVEISQFRQAREYVSDHAWHFASGYASQIESRLNTQFVTLDFAASQLVGNQEDPAHPSMETTNVLRRFLKLHPNMYVFNIQSSDGNWILWSTKHQSSVPVLKGGKFTALKSNPDFFLGQNVFAPRYGFPILPMRFRVRGSDGATLYFVGSPYRLGFLLRDRQIGLPEAFRLTVVDTRNGSVLGGWADGRVTFDRQVGDIPGRRQTVPGYPFVVQVNWPSQLPLKNYLRSAPVRWAWELGTILLLVMAAVGIGLLFRQRERDARRLMRLSEFNAMLSQASQQITLHVTEAEFLAKLCELSVKYGHMRLAWIGRPNEDGVFVILSASGAVSYLDGLFVSTDPRRPEGRGPAGRAWRERKAHFYPFCLTASDLAPWADRAGQLGFQACASVPIFRAGEVWAVLCVYHGQADIWDRELVGLLDELANLITRGLDRIDDRERAQRLEHDLEVSRNFQRILFEKNAAGMFLVDQARVIHDVNSSFCQIIGYPSDELIGQSTRMLHFDQAAFDALATLYQTQLKKGGWAQREISLRRKGGEAIVVQILGSAVVLPQGGQGIIWSVVDVTAQKRAQEKVLHQALHDPLTGLPNRRALEEYLPKAIARATRGHYALAVGMIDLDDFKPVNDTWGHECGDMLLQQLSLRLQSLLREADLLVRLGGDEFVVVLENLDEQQAIKQLTKALDRLHSAIAAPFELLSGKEMQYAEVGMTMGLALYPFDAKDAGGLLRQADAAMYQAKQRKHDRPQWWRHGVVQAEQPEVEAHFDVYGQDAASLLDKAKPYLQQVCRQFVDSFYSELSKNDNARVVLWSLTKEEMRHLKERQMAHLNFLLDAGTTRQMVESRAAVVGEIHVLVGVRPVLFTAALGLYRRLLNELLGEMLLPAKDRYHLLNIIEERLQDDLQVELEVEDVVLTKYFRVLTSPLPPQGTGWDDAATNGIQVLGSLPGVQLAVLVRLGADGGFMFSQSAGPKAEEILTLLREREGGVVIEPGSPLGNGFLAQAWRSRQVISVGACAKDARFQEWWSTDLMQWVRSTVIVPILDGQGQSIAVVCLMGGYPHQFESQAMQQWAQGLRQHWAQIWLRCSAQPSLVSEERAMEMRHALFSDGLQMYVQPIIDLGSGQVAKVETLARLRLSNGEIVLPGFFVPLLSDAELNQLFCKGLDRALGMLSGWDRQGHRVDISVNLPPSALLDSAAPTWVGNALLKHGIDADRLTLELLETQSLDLTQRDVVITDLVGLGVHLSMDDLGAGYSSLQRLSAIPFQSVKIDQGLLIKARSQPAQTLGLVSSIVQMARDLDRDVVVEGVEDMGMVEMAKVLGARYVQGFALARPMPAEEFMSWLKTFSISLENGRLHTFLGALAYHWWHSNHEGHTHPLNAPTCPLTRFLEEKGYGGSKVAAWHQTIHAEPQNQEAFSRLYEFLVDKVRHEFD